MFSVFLSSHRNTRESLWRLDKAVETLACSSCSLFFAGFLYKPCVFKTLCDVHHADRDIEPQRISTSCKLLYCRFTGLSADSSFELFVTDSSLQNVPESEGRSQELLRYVKIVGKTSHVLPLELRETQTNCGLILSAKHLLLRVRGMLGVLLLVVAWAARHLWNLRSSVFRQFPL